MVSHWTSVCPSVHPSACQLYIHLYFISGNLSKCQWIFTELVICAVVVEIWIGIANGQISSIFDSIIIP